MSFHSVTKTHSGFTLLELMVSISIGVLILTTVLIGQSTYNDGAALKALVNDASLTLRQSQVYGISVKEFTPGLGDFSVAYGLEFNTTSAGSNNAYIYFGDKGSPKNGLYDSGWSCPIGGASECIEKVILTRGNTISQMCRIYLDNTSTCDVARADVTFLRPATEAKVQLYNSSGGALTSPTIKGVRIVFSSPKAALRNMTVYTTGQISVQ